jgi:hypothetical protein
MYRVECRLRRRVYGSMEFSDGLILTSLFRSSKKLQESVDKRGYTIDLLELYCRERQSKFKCVVRRLYREMCYGV